MEFGYVRVSTSTQKIDRQLEEMHKLGLNDERIFIDYQSGKDFKRKNYQRLLKKLKKNDLVVVKSIDRLGRNYTMIIDEWRYITQTKEADIKVVDMPLLDTRTEGKNLVGKFISDVVLQVLSFVAQNERETMKQRQAEGIRCAKERGVRFGRPETILPKNFDEVCRLYCKGLITNYAAVRTLGMKRGTFFKYLKMYKDGSLVQKSQYKTWPKKLPKCAEKGD